MYCVVAVNQVNYSADLTIGMISLQGNKYTLLSAFITYLSDWVLVYGMYKSWSFLSCRFDLIAMNKVHCSLFQINVTPGFFVDFF